MTPQIAASRLRMVAWRDLMALSRVETVKELALPLPWLSLSLYLAWHKYWVPALAVSFLFFLAGLRQVHDAYHYNLGIRSQPTEWVMGVLSVVMLGSMHAVQFNHLKHHACCMEEDDVEAMSARMSWFRALLWGPMFPVMMHRQALRFASPRQRRWIHLELAANAIWIVLVFAVLRVPVLEYHVAAMATGHCFTAFFAVWTVHHDCEGSEYVARTIRNRLKSAVVFNMFFHAEDHLFPKVPTCHLQRLARRLDDAAPEIELKHVY